MELTHRFTVPAPLADTWAAFNDIESVAGCFPGATVTGVEGDEFTGTCKVKLGPIALVYGGTGSFTSKDEAAGTFALEAKGKDKRGNGTAGANVTAALTDAGGGSTEVEVVTDLHITGKPAQFGRGVIQDVSDKLLNQFVACLEQRLQGPGAAPEEAAGASAAAAAPGGTGGGPAEAPEEEAVSIRTDFAPEIPSTPATLAAVLSTPENATGFWQPTTTASMSLRLRRLVANSSPAFSAISRKLSDSRSFPL